MGEDDVLDAIRDYIEAFNDRDPDRLVGLVTADFAGAEPTRAAMDRFLRMEPAGVKIEDLEIVSVTMDNDEAAAEINATENGQTLSATISLVKASGHWRLDDIEIASLQSSANAGTADEPATMRNHLGVVNIYLLTFARSSLLLGGLVFGGGMAWFGVSSAKWWAALGFLIVGVLLLLMGPRVWGLWRDVFSQRTALVGRVSRRWKEGGGIRE